MKEILNPPPVGRLSRALVRQARALAIQEWSTSLGDTTSCASSKAGRPHPDAKSHEGKVAALGELLRTIPEDATPKFIAEEATSVRARWSDRTAHGQGGEWAAYRSGGIQAMTEIAATQSGCELR